MSDETFRRWGQRQLTHDDLTRFWEQRFRFLGASPISGARGIGLEGEFDQGFVDTLRADFKFIEALQELEGERAYSSAQIVVQGSLAYANAGAFPYRVERFIPIDIYFDGLQSPNLGEVGKSLSDLVWELGMTMVVHPKVAISSVHVRAAIQTRPMTPEELQRLEGLFSETLRWIDGQGGKFNTPRDSDADPLAVQKVLSEIIKLQAETNKIETVDAEATRADIEKTKAETKKIDTERAVAAMDALNKFASVLLKISVGVSLIIGSTSLTGSVSDTPDAHKTIKVKESTRAENIKRLGEFLKKLQEQEEAAQKAAGPE